MARLLALMLSCSLLAGCELIADFDRSKIPDEGEGRDSGFIDAAPPPGDAATDSGAPDAIAPDAAPGEDAGSEDDAG